MGLVGSRGLGIRKPCLEIKTACCQVALCSTCWCCGSLCWLEEPDPSLTPFWELVKGNKIPACGLQFRIGLHLVPITWKAFSKEFTHFNLCVFIWQQGTQHQMSSRTLGPLSQSTSHLLFQHWTKQVHTEDWWQDPLVFFFIPKKTSHLFMRSDESFLLILTRPKPRESEQKFLPTPVYLFLY